MPEWAVIALSVGVVVFLMILAVVGVLVWWRLAARRIRPPAVTNNDGAANVGPTAATLQGLVVRHGGENPSVHIYWGRNDSGTNPGAWEHDENLGAKGLGRVYHRVERLDPSNTYYYRVYARNSAGDVWAPATATFTTRAQPSSPANQAESSEEDKLLARVRKIRGHFGQEGGALDVRVPASGVALEDLRLEEWERTAQHMAEAARSGNQRARAASELLGAARDIKRAQERAQKGFRDETLRVQEAYQLLGLDPPEIRTQDDLRAAETQLLKKESLAVTSEQASEVAHEESEQVEEGVAETNGNGEVVLRTPPPMP